MHEHRRHLELARRHLKSAADHIARQRALVSELAARGQPTDLAEDLLASMIATERQMRVHYDLLMREADAD